MIRFFGASFLLLLMIAIIIINGINYNVWWIIAHLCGALGAYFFVWSIIKIPGLLRANTILKEKFAPEFNKSDLMIHANLKLPEIGTFIYKDHLFILNKLWYYSIDLSDVAWLFVIELSSSVASEDSLVVNTISKKRFYWSIRKSIQSSQPINRNTDIIKDNVNYLFDYVNSNYPDIDLGYSWEKDRIYLKDKFFLRQDFERACRYGASPKWTELNDKFNSL